MKILTLIQAELIFLGLSLDSFVLMMNKSATLRGLTKERAINYSLIFAGVTAVAVLLGYQIGFAFMGIINELLEICFASVIIIVTGLYLMYKAWKSKDTEEKLDKDFGYKKCTQLAVLTSLDTLCLAVGFSMFGFSLSMAIAVAIVITCVTILLAIVIGYSQGAKYSKVIGICGGALMIAFSLYILIKFIILR